MATSIRAILILFQLLISGCSDSETGSGADQVSGQPLSHKLRHLLVRTATNHEILPTSFLLLGVEREESNTLYGGGFADIFVGNLGKTKVAIKRLRAFLAVPDDLRPSTKQVRLLFVQ